MSARGISQTSSGEAATWGKPGTEVAGANAQTACVPEESRSELDFFQENGMRIPAKLGTSKRMQPTAEAVGR